MSEEEVLRDTIKNLYNCFAKYQVKHPIEGSPISVSTEYQTQLAQKPLRSLDADILNIYAMKAMTTWGTEDDFKHFLPRLLELTAFHARDFVAYDSVFVKLDYAQWSTWDEVEHKAIEHYLNALWQYIFLDYPSRSLSAHSFLNGVHALQVNVQPYLEFWQSNLDTLPAIRHLVDLSSYVFSDKPSQDILPWLTSDIIANHLEQAFFTSENSDITDDISYALDQITWAKQKYGKL